VHDVTAEKALRVSLHQSQKMEALGLLAGGVAHDFNNLLTVILGRADLIARRNGNPAIERDVELIGRTARQAAGLTRQLLAMSRRNVFAPEVLDVNEVVRQMEDVLRRLVGESIDVDIRLDQGLVSVKANRGQVEQIVLNLAINARDAMLRGGRLRIETANGDRPGAGSAEPDPGVVLTVSDTGCGMDEATVARIFEPFFTTKEAGTGLGLATVYGIVKQSGGEVRVASAPREGTTFRIFLPRTDAVGAVAGESECGPPPTGHETVLVVEDQAEVRELAREVLEESGYRVLHTGDAEEAVRLAGNAAAPIDLVLCDVVLRGANGFELAERLCAAGRCGRVLYMSGHAGRGALPGAAARDALPILEKPFRPHDLLRRVRDSLDAPSPRAAA
jgi:CheY-like chemotaxis protein/two-component sensor histidine kinase